MIDRCLNPLLLLKESSHFLLGPRAVGKSTLINGGSKKSDQGRKAFPVDYINLLDSNIYLRLKGDPSFLGSLIGKKHVIIDEIQRIPELLNEVHRLIEDENKKFLLTGSSARKLKKNNANLLAGRAFKSELFPLTWFELSNNKKFKLKHYLRFGGLPLAYLKPNGGEYLYSYVDTYLKEEISAEALARNLPNYVRFLQSAAFNNAQLLNYTRTANDAQLSPNTVKDYYQILEDTLIGFSVSPWTHSVKRKAIQTAKFYFFDLGVVHALCETQHLEPNSDLFGRAFEQFIACELRAYLSYKKIRSSLKYWRSKSGFEVDFIVGNKMALEVKSSRKITQRDHKGLLAICDEKKWKRLIIVSQDPVQASFKNGIQHLHWELFLTKLWQGSFF
ncbi:MAG: ATP-binding protein [Oligoflexia bacterium]|nr:ATP-binding protein [Oligoflexia bacterium]